MILLCPAFNCSALFTIITTKKNEWFYYVPHNRAIRAIRAIRTMKLAGRLIITTKKNEWFYYVPHLIVRYCSKFYNEEKWMILLCPAKPSKIEQFNHNEENEWFYYVPLLIVRYCSQFKYNEEKWMILLGPANRAIRAIRTIGFLKLARGYKKHVFLSIFL